MHCVRQSGFVDVQQSGFVESERNRFVSKSGCFRFLAVSGLSQFELWTNGAVQAHKCKYTNTITQIQIHMYKYTKTNTQIVVLFPASSNLRPVRWTNGATQGAYLGNDSSNGNFREMVEIYTTIDPFGKVSH